MHRIAARSPGAGTVAAGDRHTARAAASLLEEGGNAVDAAVGATFVAMVAEPVLTGPFGGGFGLVDPPGRESKAWDFFADVPGRGSPGGVPDDFRAVEISFGAASQVFHVGRGSVARPRLLPGLVAMQAEHGVLGLGRVLAPAIELARRGVVLSEQSAKIIAFLEPILRFTPDAERLFAPRGDLLRAGDRFVNPDMAGLFERVLREGPDVVHEALLEAFSPPQGLFTRADVEGEVAHVAPPIAVPWRSYEVLVTPPPSAGGMLVAFGLRLLSDLPDRTWEDDVTAATMLAAAMGVTAKARAALLDDALEEGGEALEAVQGRFLSDDVFERYRPVLKEVVENGLAASRAREPYLGSTTHVSVMDAQGMACAITSSNGEGSGYVVPGTGAMANNFLGEDDLHPRGFHRRPAGIRLTSMMAPTVVRSDVGPLLVLGTGGSNRIRSAILQVLVRRLLRGRSLEEAILAPRIHVQDGSIYAERRGPTGLSLTRAVLEALRRLSGDLTIFEEPSLFFGGVHAVERGGVAAGDPRRGGVVAHAGEGTRPI